LQKFGTSGSRGAWSWDFERLVNSSCKPLMVRASDVASHTMWRHESSVHYPFVSIIFIYPKSWALKCVGATLYRFCQGTIPIIAAAMDRVSTLLWSFSQNYVQHQRPNLLSERRFQQVKSRSFVKAIWSPIHSPSNWLHGFRIVSCALGQTFDTFLYPFYTLLSRAHKSHNPLRRGQRTKSASRLSIACKLALPRTGWKLSCLLYSICIESLLYMHEHVQCNVCMYIYIYLYNMQLYTYIYVYIVSRVYVQCPTGEQKDVYLLCCWRSIDEVLFNLLCCVWTIWVKWTANQVYILAHPMTTTVDVTLKCKRTGLAQSYTSTCQLTIESTGCCMNTQLRQPPRNVDCKAFKIKTCSRMLLVCAGLDW
jgi:hypothetical protein